MDAHDNWTLPLSEEGSEEILAEREDVPAETPRRLAMLARVRDAVRARNTDETGHVLRRH